METLTEIHEAEVARRERARQYEALINERLMLQGTVARLGTAVNVTALEQMRALVSEVPSDITTGRVGFMPGGANVQEVLTKLVDDALVTAQRREAERVAALGKAQQRLAEVEAEIAEF